MTELGHGAEIQTDPLSKMRIKPQSAGLDGETGKCFGGHLANLRGHDLDKVKHPVLSLYRGFGAHLGSQLSPRDKIVLDR
jgi:hypothetical protein